MTGHNWIIKRANFCLKPFDTYYVSKENEYFLEIVEATVNEKPCLSIVNYSLIIPAHKGFTAFDP